MTTAGQDTSGTSRKVPLILVVDDEPDVEDLIRQRFRREIKSGAATFAFASDGIAALEVIEAQPVDLVFTDVNMPRMDGLTLLGELAKRPDPPVTVIVSAYGDMRNIRAAMNAGAFDFITKPIEFDDLSATLDKGLAHIDRINGMKEAAAIAQRAEAALSRFFSPAVAQFLARNPDHLNTSGERREATFLFTDLQDFLPLVENHDPQEITQLLNGYLDGITRRIFDHGGTVMKIIGDSVHAAFGVPLDSDDHAGAAVACALAIDDWAEDFAAARRAENTRFGATRIGIHTGWAILGNFGGELFFDYAAYGSAVNIASRLERANKTFGTRICVSQATVERAGAFRGRIVGDLVLQGSSTPLLGYEPVPESRMTDDQLARYEEARQAMLGEAPDARQRLAALVGQDAEDALASFHLGRLLSGKWTPDIFVG